jgi:hypothetical protein
MDYEKASFIATIIACGISLIALVATLFSAAAAKESATAANDTLRHTRFSEIMSLAQSIVSDEMLIRSLSIDLKLSMQHLATATGNFGSARHRLFEEQFKKDSEQAAALSSRAQQFLNDSSLLTSSDEHSLMAVSAELRASKAKLQAQRESMERQLSDTRRQQQSLRDAALNSKAQ